MTRSDGTDHAPDFRAFVALSCGGPLHGSPKYPLCRAAMPILRRRVGRRQARLAIVEQLLAQGAGPVLALVTAAPLQLGHDEIDEAFEALRHHRVSEVEAVDAGRVDPRLHL